MQSLSHSGSREGARPALLAAIGPRACVRFTYSLPSGHRGHLRPPARTAEAQEAGAHRQQLGRRPGEERLRLSAAPLPSSKTPCRPPRPLPRVQDTVWTPRWRPQQLAQDGGPDPPHLVCLSGTRRHHLRRDGAPQQEQLLALAGFGWGNWLERGVT